MANSSNHICWTGVISTINTSTIRVGDYCTCPTSWLGLGPPPVCDFCREGWNTVAAPPPFLPMNGGNTTDFIFTTPKEATVDEAIQSLAKQIGSKIGECSVDKEKTAAFDAWQLALSHLQALKDALKRAEEA